MANVIAPDVAWNGLLAQVKGATPEIFGANDHVFNLIEGGWGYPGHGKHYFSSVDGTTLGVMPMIDLETARRAVRFAAEEQRAWAQVDLDQRRSRVSACLAGLREHRDLLARLLIWEIGKTY